MANQYEKTLKITILQDASNLIDGANKSEAAIQKLNAKVLSTTQSLVTLNNTWTGEDAKGKTQLIEKSAESLRTTLVLAGKDMSKLITQAEKLHEALKIDPKKLTITLPSGTEQSVQSLTLHSTASKDAKEELQALKDRLQITKFYNQEELNSLRERIALRKIELADKAKADKEAYEKAVAFNKAETKAFEDESKKRIEIKRAEAKAGFEDITRREKEALAYIAKAKSNLSFTNNTDLLDKQRITAAKELAKLQEKHAEQLGKVTQGFNQGTEAYITMQSKVKKLIADQAIEEDKLAKKQEVKLSLVEKEVALQIRLKELKAQSLSSGMSSSGNYNFSQTPQFKAKDLIGGLSSAGQEAAIKKAKEDLAAFEESFNAKMYALGLKTAGERKTFLDQQVKDQLDANSKLEQAEKDRLFFLQSFREKTAKALQQAEARTTGIDTAHQAAMTKLRNDTADEEAVRIEANAKIKNLKQRLNSELAKIDAKVDSTVLTAAEGVDKSKLKIAEYTKLIEQVKKLLRELDEAGAKKSNVSGLQQGVINEFSQRQQLLEKYGKLELSKRQELIDKLIALDKKKQEDLVKIASRTNLTPAGIEGRTKIVLRNYEDSRQALLKSGDAADIAKNKHIDLWQFIGKSMIIWRAYNFALNETRQLIMSIPKVGMELDSTKSVLAATMGGSAGVSAALTALGKEAERTGINIIALRENWRTFSASTTIAGESMETSWKIFSNMNTVITALHYSGDKANHIFMALSQIFNKSKVQSEELVKQLGNLLPGAFAAFAAANGKTTMQLSQDMKKGLVFAHGTIENFTKEYEKLFSVSFANASKSLNAELGRMQNSFTILGETIYKVTEKDMIKAVKALSEFAKGVSETDIKNTIQGMKLLGETVVALTVLTKGGAVITWFKELAASALLLRGFGLLGIATAITLISESVSKISTDRLKDAVADIKNFDKQVSELPEKISIKIIVDEDEGVKKAITNLNALRDEVIALQKASAGTSTVAPFMEKFLQGFTVDYYKQIYDYMAGNAVTPSNLVTLGEHTDVSQYRLPQRDLTGKKTGFTFWGTEQDWKNEENFLKGHLKVGQDMIDKARKEALDKSSVLNVARYIPTDKFQDETEKNRINAIKDRAERAAATEELAYKEGQAHIQAERDKVANNIIEANKALAMAEEAKDTKQIAKQREQLIQHKSDLEQFDKYELELQQSHAVKLDEIKASYAKKEDDFNAKRLASAKKANEDLIKLTESSANAELNTLDNALKTLEGKKDITNIADYYNQERALIDKKIEAMQRLIETTKELASNQKEIAVSNLKDNTNLGALIQAIRGGEARSGKASYDLYPTGIKNAAGLPASTAKGDMQVTDMTYTGMLQAHPEVAEAAKESAGKARVLAGEYLLKDLLDYYKDVEIAAAAYFSGTSMGTSTKVPVNAAFAKAGVQIGSTSQAGLAKVRQVLEADTTNRNGQSISGYLKNFTRNYGKGGEGFLLDSETSSTTKLTELQNKLADLQQQKEGINTKEQASLKDTLDGYAKINAEYLKLTGSMQEGVEAKTTVRYAKELERATLEAKSLNEVEKARGEEALRQVGIIDKTIIKNKEYAATLREITLIRNMNAERLNQINALEQLGLKSPVDAMMQRSSVKQDELLRLQDELNALQSRNLKPNQDGYDEAVLKVQKLKNEIEQLSLTSNEMLTTAANSVGNAFEKTFNGVLDGSIKGKQAFNEFAKSILKDLQSILVKEAKSAIINMLVKGISGAIGGAINSGLDAAPSFSSVSPVGVSNTFTPFTATAIGSSNGNIFQFSNGGIPDIGNSMQYFPMAKGGTGSLRENGKYEAILPLGRDSSGQLGIKANKESAGVSQNNAYNINVTVQGSADSQSANELGQKIALAAMQKIADKQIASANRLGNQLKPITAF